MEKDVDFILEINVLYHASLCLGYSFTRKLVLLWSKRMKHWKMQWLSPLTAGIMLTTLLLLTNNAVTHAASSSLHALHSSCQWKQVSSPSPGNDSNYLAGVAGSSEKDVWAVGNYQTSGVVQNLVEHWNGTAWSVVASPNPSSEAQLNAITRIPGTHQYWAVGEYFSGSSWHTMILRWNGSTWSQVSSPDAGGNFNFLNGVTAISVNDAWAVGNYYGGNTTITLAEHWNGKTWSMVASPNPGALYSSFSAVAAVSSHDVWAVGSYNGSSNPAALTERWNGKTWSVVANPTIGAGGTLNAVTSVPGTHQVWAVGYYFSSTSGQQPTLIERWNGKTWNVVSSPTPGASFNYLEGVTAISANNVWAVGQYSQGEVPIVALVEHWNGTSWQTVSAPSPDAADPLYAVTNIDDTRTLWSVGVASQQVNSTLTESYC